MEIPANTPRTPAETQPPQPQQPDQPTTVPTPEDPREKTPMRDPPLRPDHDKTRIAGGHAGDDEADNAAGGIRPDNPAPDSTVFDENQSAR